jgi:hypothetical protein
VRNLWWMAPVAVFFLDPSFACSDEPQFQYGAAEMLAAVGGDWSLTITPDGGTATQVTVHVDQAGTTNDAGVARAPGRGLVRAAYACGTRTLLKSAGACIDATQMPLVVTYVSGDAAFSTAAMSGSFLVPSLQFAGGDLTFTIGPYQILTQVMTDGSPVGPYLWPPGTPGTVAVSH